MIPRPADDALLAAGRLRGGGGEGERHAFLLVSDFNVDAQRFYERRGYTRVGALPALVLPEVDEVVYRRRLR